MDEKEYIASLEQGTRLLMEQNSNSRSAFKELQALHEAVVNSSAWKLTWPVRYIREKLHKPFFFTEFPDMQNIMAKAPPVLPVKLSVVVPAFQGEKELPVLLESLKAQKGFREIEYITVVTQSVDGTCDVAWRYNAKVLSISRQAFSHSAARNLGAQHAQGELLFFTVQDACFSQPDILYKMACMLLYAGADAVSCRQAPNCSADMMAKYEVQQNIITKKNNSRDHVDKMLRTPKAFREWEPMLYIDDVAHMTKRNVWENHPFRGSFAEDMLYAADLLRAGCRTGMLCSTQVCHSHTRGGVSVFWRAYQAGTGLLENWSRQLPPERTACRRTASQEAALFDAYMRGLAALYEEEKPFLKKREAACVVLTRMRAFLQAGLVGVDKAGAAPPFEGNEEKALSDKLHVLAQASPEITAAPELLGTLGEVNQFFLQEKIISLDEKGKTELFSMLVKLIFQYTGHALAFAQGSKGALPELLNGLAL